MRRTGRWAVVTAAILLAGWLLWAPTRLLAAPLFQQAVITSPQPFSEVRGRVTIEGTAVHPNFLRYELYYSPEPARDDTWVFIGEAHFNQVANGFLGTWETQALPDGLYSLRLRVVRQDYNYDEYVVRGLQVVNSRPTPTPTPAATPTPTLTPTPLPPTPTVVVVAPVLETPTPAAEEAAAQEIARASETSPQTVTSAVPEERQLPEVFTLRGMARAFWTGARWSLFTFLVVGLFFGAKWLAAWAWRHSRFR